MPLPQQSRRSFSADKARIRCRHPSGLSAARTLVRRDEQALRRPHALLRSPRTARNKARNRDQSLVTLGPSDGFTEWLSRFKAAAHALLYRMARRRRKRTLSYV